MKDNRKTAEIRKKELLMAIARIEKGRLRTTDTKLTITAVAHEVGVSTALIYNCHPEIAEKIRQLQGRSSRAQRDEKQLKFKAEREKNRALRLEISTLRSKIASLASINEMLLDENRILKTRLGHPKVVGSIQPK